MLNWTASEFAIDVIEFLKSRTMPNLPHIGIIGSKEYVSESTVDIEDLDFHTKENQSDLDNEKLTWGFIPNKFKTQLTILPTDRNFEMIMFALDLTYFYSERFQVAFINLA